MLIDITLKITKEIINSASARDDIVLKGHTGTHFDVMNKEFPIEYTKLKGYIFDVRNVGHKEINSLDVDLSKISRNMFVGFNTGFIEAVGYTSEEYHTGQPYLSEELIEKLLQKGVSIIGIDFMGVRKGKEHTPMDQYCADRGVFIVENLCNLSSIAGKEDITVYIFPMNYQGFSGLPCRVVAEI